MSGNEETPFGGRAADAATSPFPLARERIRDRPSSAAEAPACIREGAVVADRYELVRILGSGGMGTVWLASDTVRGTPCAIKLLDPEAGADPAVRSRFAREARMAARAQSANVVV